MAELHVVGQVVGASDFPLPSIFVKYSFETGSNFRLLQGQTTGQTQCDQPLVRAMPPSALLVRAACSHTVALFSPLQEGEMALLAHPLDVHYAVKGIEGWPRLRLEVYGVDSYGRIELAGYGCCIVPDMT